MIKKIISATAFTGMLLGSGSALAAGAPTLLWNAAFDAGTNESFNELIETPDGGYIGGGRGEKLIKMDANGGLEWVVSMPSPNDVNLTADGNYIVVGNDGFMAKVDAQGNIIWQKYHPKGVDVDLYSVERTSDGNFIMSGTVNLNDTDLLLMKTDSEGNSIWEKNYGGADPEFAGAARSVQQTSDGGYIVVGTTLSDSYMQNGAQVYLVRTDSMGNKRWDKKYGGTRSDYGQSVQQTPDGGFIIGGKYEYYLDTDAYLVKTDFGGNITWQRTYGNVGYDTAYMAEQTADGGYILGGKYDFTNGDSDMYAVKTDPFGYLQWQQAYGGYLQDLAYSIHQTSDGGYVVGGYTESSSQIDYSVLRLGYPTSMMQAEGNKHSEGVLKLLPYEKSSKELAAPLANR